MKKTIISAGQEILDSHIISVQDNVENALQLVLKDFMESTDGVINGLYRSDVNILGSATVEITFGKGSILLDGKYSGHRIIDFNTGNTVTLSIPSSGSVTYMISAGSKTVNVDEVVLYELVNVETRQTEEKLVPTQTASIVEFIVTNGGYANRPLDKIPLFEITVPSNMASGGNLTVVDYRKYSEIVRFRKGLQLGFKGLFYGSM